MRVPSPWCEGVPGEAFENGVDFSVEHSVTTGENPSLAAPGRYRLNPRAGSLRALAQQSSRRRR
jgi:hypothetical protein